MVKVEITVCIECKNEQLKKVEKIIKGLGCKKYTLDIIGSYINENNQAEIYIVMNTEGSYEDNLERLRQFHFNLEESLKSISIKYNGMSLVPNKVKWN
ncbi:UNVERIFIED_CONTAM: hypothetical protein C3P01_01430 [Clostridioides difficile]|uniref:hypothetical protein n=1 Tax=Clostridioides difficile TaxID=1496 RepID=UPI00038D93AE|nr:hypothetical protein [Clostridioides difficile]EQE83458.1 hypothetical protein QCW_3258 [Clostridioides difficile CD69]OYO89359.1 hypothetical protein B7359_07145 [Clostridioides difficile]HBE9726385.1 hypothetical protein [Clostridioides difficile]HBF7936521.1 hypothetical protein [Clostridioides difficile]HBG6489826.1 hypothetical protein [Clostridioides difficile]